MPVRSRAGIDLASERVLPERADASSECRIAEHAIIGDSRSAALVATTGSIDWLCLPDFSAPSLFAAILDADEGGRFAITPKGDFTTGRRYAGSTAVLETTFRTPTGSARLTDAMIVGDGARRLEPRREIVRIVEGLEGLVPLEICFDPRPNYARSRCRPTRCGPGWSCAWGDELLLLRSECPLRAGDDGLSGEVEVRPGERLTFSLSYEKGDIAVLLPLGEGAADRVRRTATWWEDWSAGCACVGSHRDAVRRSAITLKLMTFALSGAVVAAPTASLPEWIGSGRNWDYRYCWLRDASLTMRAFTSLGLIPEAGAFLRWLLHATALTQPRLSVIYDVFGRSRLPEFELDHLRGHRGSAPVRIGNGAWRQTQLDVYGEVIAAAVEYVDAGGDLQRDQRRLLARFGETVCKVWRQPDNGIWEIRGGKRHYTFSKLMCWVALDRLLALHRRRPLDIEATRVETERQAIAEAIEGRAYNEDLGAYAGELGGDRLDAAVLLMPCLGYGDPGDPRHASTFARIDQDLGHDGLIHRYRPSFDAIGTREGAFGICSFWAVENLARRGRVDEAARRFDRLLAHANDLGLFAEEIDPESGEALGNFPQAFTHVGLINAAVAIQRERERGTP